MGLLQTVFDSTRVPTISQKTRLPNRFSSFPGQFKRVGEGHLSFGGMMLRTYLRLNYLSLPHQPSTYINLPSTTTFIDHSPLLLFGGWAKHIFIHSFMTKVRLPLPGI